MLPKMMAIISRESERFLFRKLHSYARGTHKGREVFGLFIAAKMIDYSYTKPVMDLYKKVFHAVLPLGFVVTTMVPHAMLQCLVRRLDCPKTIGLMVFLMTKKQDSISSLKLMVALFSFVTRRFI